MPRGEHLKGKRPPGAGRKKGVPNKLTRSIKACIEGAFEQAGGQAYLYRVSKRRPDVFLAFVAKILPKQLEHSGPDGKPLQFNVVNYKRNDSA